MQKGGNRRHAAQIAFSRGRSKRQFLRERPPRLDFAVYLLQIHFYTWGLCFFTMMAPNATFAVTAAAYFRLAFRDGAKPSPGPLVGKVRQTVLNEKAANETSTPDCRRGRGNRFVSAVAECIGGACPAGHRGAERSDGKRRYAGSRRRARRWRWRRRLLRRNAPWWRWLLWRRMAPWRWRLLRRLPLLWSPPPL